MTLSRTRRLCGILAHPAAAIPLMCVAWLVLMLHPGPLVRVLTIFSPGQAAAFSAVAATLLLWRRPASANSLFALVLLWMSVAFAVNFSTGLDTFCNAKVLIPIGDSAGYSFEASKLASGNRFSEWAAAHVMSHSWFAGLILLTARNLVLIHLVTGLFGALAITFSTAEVRRWAGPVAAGVFLWASMLLLVSSLGTFASESYGLSMGLIATALLLRGLETGALRWQLSGLAALSFALAARPGAMLVLPLVGIAIASLCGSWRKRLLTLAFAAACAVSGLAVNAVLTLILCEPSTVTMSMDIWHHMNGLLTGGSWNSSIATQSAAEARDNVLKILSDNPLVFVSASWKALRFFFAENIAFSFLPLRWMGTAAAILFGIGAAVCVFRIRDGLHRVVLLSALGIVLSTPFVPPWDAGLRPYLATVPLQMLCLCAALGAAAKLIPERINQGETLPSATPDSPFSGAYPAVLAGMVVCVGCLLPVAMRLTPLHLPKAESWYWEGWMHVRLIPGSYIRVVEDSAARASYVPTIRRADYLRPQPGFSWMFRADDTAIFSRMPSGVLITRSDATGLVFVIKDEFGDTLPDSVDCAADILRLRGDNVAFDKRIGFDIALAAALLDSVYLPWLTGYDYYYHYHSVLGTLEFVENVPGGRLVIRTEKFGTLETSRDMFPLFRSRDTGLSYRLDMEKKTFDEVAPDEAAKP